MLFTSAIQVPSGARKLFAVCPDSLTQAQAAALEREQDSFAMVHPMCRVTSNWIDACRKVGQEMMA